MQVQWGAALLAWLLGVAVQLQQGSVGDGRWAVVLPMACVMLAGMGAWMVPRWRHGWRSAVLACLCMASLGWGQAEWRAAQRLAQMWPGTWAQRSVVLTGRVDSLPQKQAWGQRFEVEVLTVDLPSAPGQVAVQGTWQAGQVWRLPGVPAKARCPQRISLSWTSGQRPSRPGTSLRDGDPGTGPAIVPGQVWRWTVQLQAPDGLLNPGGFDAERWMFERGLRAQGRVVTRQVPAPLLVRSISPGAPGLIDRMRLALRDRIEAHVTDPQVAGLIAGLTIGEQSAIEPQDWDALRDTGTAHLAAISGMHVLMMGLLVSFVVGRVWRRSPGLMRALPAPVAARVAAVAGAWAYAVLAGWGIPAQRTVVMMAVVAALRLGARRWPWPLVLLLAAVVVTLLDPWALNQAGFWLSFAAVGLLMLSGQQTVSTPDLPWRQRAGRALREGLRTQWVAWVGLAPLSLVFFQQVSLVGLLANLACIPLFSFVITPLALLGLAWSGFWDGLTPLVQHLMVALGWLASWRWAAVSGAMVSSWASMLGLLAGAWMLAPVPLRWKLLAVPGMLLLLWPTSLSMPLPGPPVGHAQILAVDIGQGTAVLVRTARHALLYDTGPRTSPTSDAGRRVLVGLLRGQGIRRLDTLLISHGDIDHVGGAESVVRAVPVGALLSSLGDRHELLSVPDRDGRLPLHQRCEAGQQWRWDGVLFEVLHPSKADWAQWARGKRSDNAMSCVLRVSASAGEGGGRSVLLTGDVEAQGEASLVQAWGARLASEVLMVPHHGSHTSSTPDFIEAVAPRVAVVQSGARNRYGHPHADVMARYQAQEITVVRSTTCGAWIWRTDMGPAAQAGRCWRELAGGYWRTPRAVSGTDADAD
ncbi:MAG: DNA internalization-related competence protein ComEC/Rec2 [Aquabacterium sp.]|jgi:competence protein ComEC|uniref:DNA internalization-related competence protein ComEC/Rec2 n=1 Tax=Aquabacterium sp. TaxID=1872578 RepID=UPI003BAF773B